MRSIALRVRRRFDRLSKSLAGNRLRRFYSRWIRPGGLCFDIGANVGERTDLFRSIGARVVSVEPQPSCAEILRRKYRREPDVIVEETALGAGPGKVRLHLADATTLATTEPRWKTGRFRDRDWGDVIEVRMSTLDALIERWGRPSFCKIDVEGAELEVLRGLSSPLPALSFEFTEEFLDQARLCAERLASIGFTEFNFTTGESPQLQIERWVEASELTRALEHARRPGLWGDVYARSDHRRTEPL